MVEGEKSYINKKNRVMHFETGLVVLAMIKLDSKGINPKVSSICKIIYGSEPSKTALSRVAKIVDSIVEGIYIGDEAKPFRIINLNTEFKVYNMDYKELFKLFLKTLNEYPMSDEDIPLNIINDIRKEETKFNAFMKGFASEFNFKEQEWALFELGQTLSQVCVIYLYHEEMDKKSPWYQLGKFTWEHTHTLRKNFNLLLRNKNI